MKILYGFEQRSEEWFKARTGLITMSHAKELLTQGKTKKTRLNSVMRATYLRSVAAEILAGREKDGYQSDYMIRGQELEPYAVRAYECETGIKVSRVGFVLHDDERIGCSPDGLTPTGGVEIKCPMPKLHLFYMAAGNTIKEHGQQMQGNMWVCDRDRWDFVSFCPWVQEMPLIVHPIDEDPGVIDKLWSSALRGADEVDALVAAARAMRQLNKETRAIAVQAIEYWEALSLGVSSEVKL